MPLRFHPGPHAHSDNHILSAPSGIEGLNDDSSGVETTYAYHDPAHNIVGTVSLKMGLYAPRNR